MFVCLFVPCFAFFGSGFGFGFGDQRDVDKVDATMDEVRNQLELTKEITDAISNAGGIGIDVRFPPSPSDGIFYSIPFLLVLICGSFIVDGRIGTSR